MVLGNNDVRIGYVVTGTDPSPLYRNAIGDECVYVESGTGTVETVFGVISYRTGDYVLIPRSTDHRWVPSEPSRLYPIEANSHISPPRRYLSRYGQLLEHAPYCERDLHGPGETCWRGSDVEVLVKHRTGGQVVGTRLTYATHPFDVVGWDGCLYPLTFNVEDYMPITGKIHQPPPVHQVWEGHNFVVCNFLPRKVDYHPLAIPVPYYHSNVDSDEVMFYVGGDYEARKGSGINLGSISLHPGGYAHGPQPSAIEASLGAEFFDESAVMVDTFAPSSSAREASRPRTRRTHGPGPAADPTPVTSTATVAPPCTPTPEARLMTPRRPADDRDPHPSRRTPRWAACHERTADPPAAAALADRRLVLPGPLRAGPGRRDRRHAGRPRTPTSGCRP